MTRLLAAVFALIAMSAPQAAAQLQAEAKAPAESAGKSVVYVIPVKEQIADPVLYIVRRGLKEAIERKADAVILDMDTPGGSGAVMLEIMEALDKFDGDTVTYVNREAGSAGAIIAAVTDEIYFAPGGVMGAAEMILSTGADVGDGLKRKMNSYVNAKIRAYSSSNQRRADVLKAMMSPDFELKLDEKVIKPKGELLTITADEAIALYGEPPTPLLAAGIADNLDSLLEGRYGRGGFEKIALEVTWSEEVARYLTTFAPILMGLGLLALFIEFKTPGFGWMGATGILLMLVVFFGHYVAGLSGHEPALLFGLGVLLLAVELFIFPGAVLPALAGMVFMLASLVWAGADVWPDQPITSLSGEIFVRPIMNLLIALAIAVTLFGVLMKYLPKTGVWANLSVGGASAVAAQHSGAKPEVSGSLAELVGRQGVAVTALFPSGEVEVDGRRFQAKLELGFAEAKTPVIVTGYTDFSLKVEKAEGA